MAWISPTAYNKTGLLTAVYELGAGRFILNMLEIRKNLVNDPAAELLLRNMLNYIGRDLSKPAKQLPPDFEELLEKLYKSSPAP